MGELLSAKLYNGITFEKVTQMQYTSQKEKDKAIVVFNDLNTNKETNEFGEQYLDDEEIKAYEDSQKEPSLFKKFISGVGTALAIGIVGYLAYKGIQHLTKPKTLGEGLKRIQKKLDVVSTLDSSPGHRTFLTKDGQKLIVRSDSTSLNIFNPERIRGEVVMKSGDFISLEKEYRNLYYPGIDKKSVRLSRDVWKYTYNPKSGDGHPGGYLASGVERHLKYIEKNIPLNIAEKGGMKFQTVIAGGWRQTR